MGLCVTMFRGTGKWKSFSHIEKSLCFRTLLSHISLWQGAHHGGGKEGREEGGEEGRKGKGFPKQKK